MQAPNPLPDQRADGRQQEQRVAPGAMIDEVFNRIGKGNQNIKVRQGAKTHSPKRGLATQLTTADGISNGAAQYSLCERVQSRLLGVHE